jgi:hypothetical protein
MAGTKKRQRPSHDAPERSLQVMDAERVVAVAGDAPFAENGHGAAGVVVYVLGGGGAGVDRNPAQRDFPLVKRTKGESDAAHLMRIVHQVDEAMAAGATHLLVPREQVDWLGNHPRVAEYLAEHHDLTEARAETGLVFTLRPPGPVAFKIEVAGWEIVPGEGIVLTARQTLVEPRVTLRPTAPARGVLTGRLAFLAASLPTLRLRFSLASLGSRRAEKRELVLSLARPGYLFHDLPFVDATFDPDGTVRLEFDLSLDDGLSLDRIRLELVEEDNWRMHPDFPGGTSFALPVEAPAGARLELRELSLRPAESVRMGPPYGTVRASRPAPYRKPAGRPRDAVIFSSWVPEAGLALGDYFIETLRRYHADSKIFVGINHGSSPQWGERLQASGLDLTIQPAVATLTMPSDPTGFAAALDAYRRHDEPFELVWFGHNKGGNHLDKVWYATGRWMIERMFWSRRPEIERYFEDPTIGVYAPHYLMMLQRHLRQTDALLRMYQATCAPLGAMAVSTHFVMRNESVRDFCARVDNRFFRYGPKPFGADRFFFEMAIPNVPIMQGYEPYIEPGLGGTSGHPKMDGVESIHNDWRQNNAVGAIELEKWRRDPTGFRTDQREHKSVD